MDLWKHIEGVLQELEKEFPAGRTQGCCGGPGVKRSNSFTLTEDGALGFTVWYNDNPYFFFFRETDGDYEKLVSEMIAEVKDTLPRWEAAIKAGTETTECQKSH